MSLQATVQRQLELTQAAKESIEENQTDISWFYDFHLRVNDLLFSNT